MAKAKGAFLAANVGTMNFGLDENGKPKLDGRKRDPACLNFYLWSRGGGKHRSYQYRYDLDGKSYEIAIGSINKITLSAAHAKADDYTAILRAGGNPAIQIKVEAEPAKTPTTVTLREAVMAFFARERGKPGAPGAWDDAHAKIWTASMENHVLPHMANRDIATITVAEVKALFEPTPGTGLWHTHSVTAYNILCRLRGVWNYAIETDDDDRMTLGNVAQRAMIRLPKNVRPASVPHPSVPWEQMPEFFRTIREREELAALMLAFTIFSGVRTGEVNGMKWREIDGDIWHVPGVRVKSGNDRDAPLTPLALELLALAPGNRDPASFVFPGRNGSRQGTVFSGHIAHDSMQILLRRELILPYHVHGFRSSFLSWATKHARSEQEKMAAEIAVDHVVGNKVHRAYDRETLLPERRALAHRWGDHLMATADIVDLAA